MFITKMSLPRRTFLRGMGAAVALPLLDAMVPALTALAQTAAAPAPRFGAVYIPNGAIMEQWIPETVGTGFEFTPILKPLEPFRESVDVVTNLTRSHPGSQVGDHAVSAGGVPHRRVAEADRGGGRPRQHDDRSDRGPADRPGHAVPVARGRDRGLHRLRRRLFARLQLLVHEHGVVELADDAAADGHQPAGGVRAHVRPGRHRGAAAARMRDERSMLDSIAQEASTLQRGLGARDRERVSEYLDNLREIERRIQRTEAHNDSRGDARYADRRARLVRGARGADVRPAGGGLSGRRHARLHVHAVARAEPAHLSRRSASPSSITPCRITATTRTRSRRTSR